MIKSIGTGAFAKVMEAEHILTKIHVAIKIINKKLLKDSNMKKRIVNEVYIHKTMDHPGISKLYEVLENSKNIFIVLELGESIIIRQ